MTRVIFLLFFVCSNLLLAKTSTVNQGKLAKAARFQIGKTVSYDPAYRRLSYPNGDVPMKTGVCSDVVVRAFRRAWQIDLQSLVHRDMKRHFSKYPKRWGLRGADRNIDHRRVPNLETFFHRMGWGMEVTKEAKNYQAGDIVTCLVGGKTPHIMIVSHKKSKGVPLVIHNKGFGVCEENRLFTYVLTGHFRIK